MAEENKNDGADDPISLLLEQALTRKRDEMMENFSHILQCLLLSLCNFLEVEKEEIHKGNLNQPLLKLGSSPSSFREGSLYLV
jgi:hypothetical protein